ncbi:hypothetical protein NLG97_g4541 [Lecanicillium saksenae]|uniref:Uncharacterized protein n=1 Tax=Lecanicillium saksenae TaxID=468837 RepID=A0ACC1QV03_9HYPO|nr:hypothetical protein NLG97_g4541 [Lecanicillium saksenae]
MATLGDDRLEGRQDHTAAGHSIVIMTFLCLAMYNVLELQYIIFSAFKKYQGLYFWSCIISSWGIAFNATGYMLRHLQASSKLTYATVILIGWSTMITGQSLILYSRLHLVCPEPRRLRYVLAMIIVDAVWLGIPIIVLVYGTNSSNPLPFERPYDIFEKIQLVVFFVQEVIISSIYITEASRLLKFQFEVGSVANRGIMGNLILVNAVAIILDLTIIVLEITNHYDIQTAWKPFVYSVKLKIEFIVLNRLVEFSRQLQAATALQYSDSADAFAMNRRLGQTNTPSDITYR